MLIHSHVVGQAALSSSSRGLGPIAKEHLGRAPTLYEEFLTSGLSQRIEEDKGPDLHHTLVRHALMTVSLAYKDILESKENDVERRELRDELVKVRKELTVGIDCEKQLAADLKEPQAHEKDLELKLKKSAVMGTKLQADIERIRGELVLSQGLLEKSKEDLAKKDEELA
ncbi:hypothetical protein ACOSQ2_032365 [Xanthoceras sorbifolium]